MWADLGHELEGLRVQLDQAAGVPGGVEAVAPGQRAVLAALGEPNGEVYPVGRAEKTSGWRSHSRLLGAVGTALPAGNRPRSGGGAGLEREPQIAPKSKMAYGMPWPFRGSSRGPRR